MKKYAEVEMDRCDCNVIHDDVVEHVRGEMPEQDVIADLGELFKMFGDPTRLKILCALGHHEMCGCDLASLLGTTKSAVSHQLRVLKQGNLVKNRREGKVVYYSIADEHVATIIRNGMDHVNE